MFMTGSSKQIFHNHFYSLVTPPNKEQLLDKISTLKPSNYQHIPWYQKERGTKHERVDHDDILVELSPSIKIFFEELGINPQVSMKITDIWTNVYSWGSYQEIHDHHRADLIAVVFVEDNHKDASQFFFYNRHQSEVTYFWESHLQTMHHVIEPKRGDVLLFPGWMLHGVTTHQRKKQRKTLSLNINIHAA